MKKIPLIVVVSLVAIATCLAVVGCKSPTLEAGGAYSGSVLATNATTGTVSTNQVSASDMPFEVADAAYKLAYQAVDGVLLIEFKNRTALLAAFPALKPALDKIRPTIWDIDQRWALARKTY